MKSEQCADCKLLSEKEVRTLRAMIETRGRLDWLWNNLGKWIQWGITVGAAAIVIWENVRHFFKWLEGL